MVIAAATFALILVIVLGMYWVLIVRVENLAGARLRDKIEGRTKTQNAAVAGLLRQTERMSDVRALDRLLLRATGLLGPMQRAITQSGLRVTVGTIVLASGCLGGTVFLVLDRVTRVPLLAVAGGAVALTLPYFRVCQVRDKRARKLEEQFPEAIDLLSRALRAGHALTTGLAMVAEELPEPMGGEFRLLHDQQTFGRPVPEALKNFALRVPAPDARFFVTAVLTQRDAGGNLSELLDNLSAIIRDRFRVKRQIRVISAHGRITGWVLGGLTPTLVLVFMYIMPENYASFYRDPLGVRMIVAAALLQLAGIAMIRKIVSIETEVRMQIGFGLALAAVFLSVALVSGSTIWLVLGWNAPERRQIRRLSRDRSSGGAIRALSLIEAPSALVKRLQQIVPKSPKDLSRLRRRLATAGVRSASAAAVFAASELLLFAAFGLLVVGVRGVSRGGWIFGLTAAAIGYLLPGLWLARRTTQRQRLIQNGLPDALDLFIVCIEAGSSLDQAIVKSSDELAISHPTLAEELRLVTTETRTGKPRIEAFKNFASRTKVDDVRALTAMLIQTDRFGTSIAQALRTHAETSRIQRRQRAEERAGKIGVKLVFPLVFCLFPALYVAILGPAIVNYIRYFKGGLR